MSSYTVNKAVIDALVTAAIRWSEGSPVGLSYHWHHGAAHVDAEAATALGQMLWHANWYHADGWVKDAEWARDEIDVVPEEPVYEFEPLPGVPAPLVVLRLIDNYTYQTAGEPEEWRPTEPFGFCHALRGEAIDRLPGYKDLPWTIGPDDRDIYLRLGGPEPAIEPLPVDTDDPNWVELNALLLGTGVPFEAMSPKERRRTAEQFGGATLRGHWLARWPEASTPTVVVALHTTEPDALAGFETGVQMARSLSTPRYSFEVLRRGCTVVLLKVDHWTPGADEWLDLVRSMFTNADARNEIPRQVINEPPTN